MVIIMHICTPFLIFLIAYFDLVMVIFVSIIHPFPSVIVKVTDPAGNPPAIGGL